MNMNRRSTLKILGLTLALAGLGTSAVANDRDDDDEGFRAGRVFTSTNAVGANELLVYAVNQRGGLTLQTPPRHARP
ncbi:MAG: hypothetical protein IPP88_08055, partial [Betaproteobacteria bacterium]|nr:hypothetical protein [Betaproteobacteria bacterium]